jgi:glucosamine-6-phosphate deaminase
MGIGSIMTAKRILFLATGANKADAVKGMLFGPITPKNPSSALQLHRHVDVVLTEDAAAGIIGLLKN